MPKWMRILVAFGVAAIGCGIYTWFFGAQTFLKAEALYMAHKAPIIAKYPVELANLDFSGDHGKELSYLGYGFVAPWPDFDEGSTKIIGNKAVVAFHSRNAILLSVVPAHDFIVGLSEAIGWKPKTTNDLFRRLYGNEVINSDYSIMKAILETTPSRITLFTPERDAFGVPTILMLKGLMAPSIDAEIYSVHTTKFQGFQLGNPRLKPRTIRIELYSDEVELEFSVIQMVDGAVPAITQKDLNCIAQTAHKL
jgi:hypothetical protein